MRMTQSLEEIERAFAQEIRLEQRRRHSLIRSTEQRSLRRDVDRRHRQGSLRFMLLVLALILTAVLVTVVMFRVLYMLLS